MKRNYSNKKIGVLGGGQLARMLALKGHELGLEMHVLSASPDDPAAQVTHFWHQGDLNKKADLKNFMEKMDVVTLESEFINAKLLQELAREHKYQIQPRPTIMEQLQDRLNQKNLFKKYGIPTSPYVNFNASMDWAEIKSAFPKACVFKQRRNGYDGYGTHIVKSEKGFAKFKEETGNQEFGFIAENFVPFKRELSLICVRNRKGQFVHFPLSESFQKDARCFWVRGPVSHRAQSRMVRKFRQLLHAINYVGVFGVELFDTGKELLVNEIAPRVHNTGHHSLNSMEIDQFTYHLYAILNSDLPVPKVISPGYAMVNLLGKTTKTPTWDFPHQVNLHWYGKSENRPGRKMGHLNAIAKSPKQALENALKAAKEISI